MNKSAFLAELGPDFLTGAVFGFVLSSALRWLRRLSWHVRSILRMIKVK